MVAIEPLATTAAAFAIGVGSVAIGVGVLMMRVPFLTIDMKAWPALVVALVVAVCAGQAVGVLVAIRGARPGYAST
jgi:riboflavin transporter FmnP